jgi:alpha-aminoadipate/glutamate carrier protein LysW
MSAPTATVTSTAQPVSAAPPAQVPVHAAQPVSQPLPPSSSAVAPSPPVAGPALQPLANPPECTECAAAIPTTPQMPGEILDCPECGVELEVRSIVPLVLAVAPEVEEDWGE